MLLRKIKDIFHQELDDIYGQNEVNSFFYVLIEEQLQLKRFVLALQPEYCVSKKEETSLFSVLSRLKMSEPIQYVLGKTYFMEMEFIVNDTVLIPRPETEELVRWIISKEQGIGSKVTNTGVFRILDIGTGSGCIAICLARNFPEAEVYAIDISRAALEVAQRNAKLNSVEVRFLEQDVFELDFELDFDIIVSNPPYVRESEKHDMHNNVLNNEPAEALFVSDVNPLKFYKTITEFATKNLKENGILFFEVNQYLGKETRQLLQDHNFSEIELRKDMFGKDRMLKGVVSKSNKAANE